MRTCLPIPIVLEMNGRLRGCRGATRAVRTLREGVVHFAQEAAFKDPRFPPVTREELRALRIKISVLSPLQRVASADQIVPGKHGVSLRLEQQRGLFLPTVWNKRPGREAFLSALCVDKAQLPAECWKDPQTELSVFTTTDFEN